MKIAWRTGKPSGRDFIGDWIVIDMSQDTPADLKPGALASAYIGEGHHITVFYDRVLALVSRNRVPTLLGHVLAHEMTHILQNTGTHSETGLMKAHWDEDDLAGMTFGTLLLTPLDVQMIEGGLRFRASRPSQGSCRLSR